MESIDVAVVGGGPAGLSTAMHLLSLDASWARRLIVLEKQSHPRPKLCAGGLTRFGLTQLGRLGLTLGVPHIRVEEARMEYRGRVVRVRGRPVIAVTRRPEFDAWLADEARARGVDLREQSPVTRLERRAEGLVLHTPGGALLARAVVGADGSRGVVRRWLNGAERPARVARLLEIVLPAAGSEPEFQEAFARFDFTPAAKHLQGYMWNFPSLVAGAPHLNRGVYDARCVVSKPKPNLPALLRKEEEPLPPLKGHPIHWFSPSNRVSAPHLLMAGDAAGAEPLFGEGIGPALAYGEVAARSLQRAFQRGDFRFQDYRPRVLASPLGRYLMLRRAAAAIAYRLSDYDIFMRLLWRTGDLLARSFGPGRPPPGLPPVDSTS